MIHSESIVNLAVALSKAQKAMKHAAKDSNNPFFHSKYADLASVVDAARPALAANGLSVVQCTWGSALWTMLLHESGEWIKGSIDLKPMRQVKDKGWEESHDPQSYGSCITYARRYALAAITGVATEDDDGNAASGKQVAPPVRKMVEAKVVDPAGPSPAVETQPPPPPAATAAKKDDAELRHELQEIAAIAEEAGLYPTVADAIYFATSYTTKDGKEAGYKDVLKLKGWQMSKAIDKLNARLNAIPPAPVNEGADDIPF